MILKQLWSKRASCATRILCKGLWTFIGTPQCVCVFAPRMYRKRNTQSDSLENCEIERNGIAGMSDIIMGIKWKRWRERILYKSDDLLPRSQNPKPHRFLDCINNVFVLHTIWRKRRGCRITWDYSWCMSNVSRTRMQTHRQRETHLVIHRAQCWTQKIATWHASLRHPVLIYFIAGLFAGFIRRVWILHCVAACCTAIALRARDNATICFPRRVLLCRSYHRELSNLSMR